MSELTSKKFWADALVRAIRTMAQAAIGIIGAGAAMSDVDWMRVLSGSALAGLVSVLMSLDRIGTMQTQSASAAIPANDNATITENGGNDHDGNATS